MDNALVVSWALGGLAMTATLEVDALTEDPLPHRRDVKLEERFTST